MQHIMEQAVVNDKKEILGWTMYDWANSAFSTTVVTTLLGPYLTSLSNNLPEGGLRLGGTIIPGESFFSYCVSLSVILQVFLLPILGTIADFSDKKKSLMLGFAYSGAAATIALFFVQGDLVLLGGFLFIIANLCFGAAIVFYNAYLPDIASPDQRDAISSKGFALGYLGGGFLLMINLGMIQMMEDTGLAVRLSLASAGVWWMLFTFLFPHKRLIKRPASRTLPDGTNYFSQGVSQIFKTFKEMRSKYPETFRYLVAYLIYNDGIQTVVTVSSLFATSELGAEPNDLIMLILMIQFVGFAGAYLFGFIAGRIGAKKAIMLSIAIWAALVIYTYMFVYDKNQLWFLGVVIAIVLGGSQALSRSLYSQMIPADHEAEYFGFYEVSERGTSWIGPIIFGVAVQVTGSSRIAIVSLIVFFVVGLILLYPIDVKKAIEDSGHSAEGVIL